MLRTVLISAIIALTPSLVAADDTYPANNPNLSQYQIDLGSIFSDKFIASKSNFWSFDAGKQPLPKDNPVINWSIETIKNIESDERESENRDIKSIWSSKILEIDPNLFGLDQDNSVLAIIEQTVSNEKDMIAYRLNFRRYCSECAPPGDPIPYDPPVPPIPYPHPQPTFPVNCLMINEKINCF